MEAPKPTLSLLGAKVSHAVRKKLELASKSVSRFLYRAWQGSDDLRMVEGDDSIVPGSLMLYETPQSMFDVPEKVFVTSAKAHLRGHQIPSLYSD